MHAHMRIYTPDAQTHIHACKKAAPSPSLFSFFFFLMPCSLRSSIASSWRSLRSASCVGAKREARMQIAHAARSRGANVESLFVSKQRGGTFRRFLASSSTSSPASSSDDCKTAVSAAGQRSAAVCSVSSANGRKPIRA